MELFVEKGISRQECELKIAEKYKRPFHIVRVEEIRIGGLLGLFTKKGVEVQFYFSPMLNRQTWQPAFNPNVREWSGPLSDNQLYGRYSGEDGSNGGARASIIQQKRNPLIE